MKKIYIAPPSHIICNYNKISLKIKQVCTIFHVADTYLKDSIVSCFYDRSSNCKTRSDRKTLHKQITLSFIIRYYIIIALYYVLYYRIILVSIWIILFTNQYAYRFLISSFKHDCHLFNYVINYRLFQKFFWYGLSQL